MTQITARAVVVVAVVVLTAGCGDKPDAAACETAIRTQAAYDLAHPGTKGEKPAECNGLSDAEVERIAVKVAGDVANQQLGQTAAP